MTYPCRATYTPVPGKLSFAVTVLAERQMFGRKEYAIQAPTGEGTIWITAGPDGSRLKFEDGDPEIRFGIK